MGWVGLECRVGDCGELGWRCGLVWWRDGFASRVVEWIAQCCLVRFCVLRLTESGVWDEGCVVDCGEVNLDLVDGLLHVWIWRLGVQAWLLGPTPCRLKHNSHSHLHDLRSLNHIQPVGVHVCFRSTLDRAHKTTTNNSPPTHTPTMTRRNSILKFKNRHSLPNRSNPQSSRINIHNLEMYANDKN